MWKSPEYTIENIHLDFMDILDLLEEIERRWFQLYIEMADQFQDVKFRETCRQLAAYHRTRMHKLTQVRMQMESNEKPKAFTRNHYLPGNVRAFASLAFFTRRAREGRSLPNITTCRDVLGDAATRSKESIAFYQGLKEFTYDHAVHSFLDGLIKQERDLLLLFYRLV
jgi:rubrerythrin